MDISIIIVSWNVKDKLRDNLKALYKSGGNFSFEVFVVDNNSYDGSAEMVRTEFPQVKLVVNKDNLGFAKANNQAIRQSMGNYVLLLNPDMRVFPDTLNKMLVWMRENLHASIASCHIVDEQGHTVKHVRHFPTVGDQLAIILKIPHLFPGVLNKYLWRDFDYNRESQVDSIRGSFFMIRREVIDKLGGLDERYFLWFEEVDYCRQVKKVGWKVIYTPVAKCIDYVGKSFSQLPRGQAQKYFCASQLKYFKKWQPGWQYWLLRLAWPLGTLMAVAGDRANLKSKAKT